MQYRISRVMVAAIQGRSGKTTFTIGLLKALTNRGLSVQSFKKGPDYIDPSWASFASGIPCRNLDAVMMKPKQITHAFCQAAQRHDLAIIEGAMGIFDGLDVAGSNSSAELAHLLKVPVILIVSGQRITRSVAAIINGVVAFDPRIEVAGVILNQVARERHLRIMTASIEKYCNVPILGALPKMKDIEIPDRHLGLIPAGEQETLLNRIERLGRLIEENVDIDRIIDIAQKAEPIVDEESFEVTKIVDPIPKIGYFHDRAFSFYYPENLEALRREGAELVALDAFQAKTIEGLDGLYIGGGFPEVLANELSNNESLRNSVREGADSGLPIYAECGGLMYLSQAIVEGEKEYPMAGVFPCKITMEAKPQGHGYAIQEATAENPYFPEHMEIKGHEFHHSKVHWLREEKPSYGFLTKRGKGIANLGEHTMDALIYKNTLACYHHFHASSTPVWAENFVEKAKSYKIIKQNYK